MRETNNMSQKKLETLVATMNRTDMKFLDNMNLKGDIIVGNQNGSNDRYQVESSWGKALVLCSDEKGLSRNRNLTLKNASSEICLLADDDLFYENDYDEIINKQFSKNPKADIIIFNLHENPIRRFVVKNQTRIHWFNYMRYGSVRIAFRRKAITSAGISFDERFGAGADIPVGEDTIFLHDCLKKGLKIYAVPDYILTLTNERESTWFAGYSERYFYNKGALYSRISSNKLYFFFLCFQDVIRHHKKYKSSELTMKKILILLFDGAKLNR